MSVVTLQVDEIASLIDPEKAIEAIQHAYVRFYEGEIAIPFPYHFEPTDESVVHIKSAVKAGDRYVVKIASFFPDNPSKGLTSLLGLVILFDGTTGQPAIIMFDNALLTHHRTAAAGAVGARLLSRENSETALILGTGTQGAVQLDYLTRVRSIKRVLVRGLDAALADDYIGRQQTSHPNLEFSRADDLAEACGRADIIVTTTPNRQPVIMADWVGAGTHITAVGSDNPGKQELDPHLLKKSIYVTDSTPQCAKNGELQHALAAGVMSESEVRGEIGAILAGKVEGRKSDKEITLFDSTGLGAQDLAIANLVYETKTK